MNICLNQINNFNLGKYRQEIPDMGKVFPYRQPLSASLIRTGSLNPAHDRKDVEKTWQRLNGEIKRRTDIVGIVPNQEAITHLIGAILLK